MALGLPSSRHPEWTQISWETESGRPRYGRHRPARADGGTQRGQTRNPPSQVENLGNPPMASASPRRGTPNGPKFCGKRSPDGGDTAGPPKPPKNPPREGQNHRAQGPKTRICKNSRTKLQIWKIHSSHWILLVEAPRMDTNFVRNGVRTPEIWPVQKVYSSRHPWNPGGGKAMGAPQVY